MPAQARRRHLLTAMADAGIAHAAQGLDGVLHLLHHRAFRDLDLQAGRIDAGIAHDRMQPLGKAALAELQR